MLRKGKHAKPDRHILRKAAVGFLIILIIVQALMFSDSVRSRLSIVDRFEGQSVGTENDEQQK